MFTLYSGDTGELTCDSDHLVYLWDNSACKILFSITRAGNSALCHFSSDKAGLKLLRFAMNDFSDFIFKNLKWCEMILANVKMRSVSKLIQSVGFAHIASNAAENTQLYMRLKHG